MKIFNSTNMVKCLRDIENDKFKIQIHLTESDFICSNIKFDRQENFISFYSETQIFVHSLDQKKKEYRDGDACLDFKLDENIY